MLIQQWHYPVETYRKFSAPGVIVTTLNDEENNGMEYERMLKPSYVAGPGNRDKAQ